MPQNYFFTKNYELSKFGEIFARPRPQSWVTVGASSNSEHKMLHFYKTVECSFQRVFQNFFISTGSEIIFKRSAKMHYVAPLYMAHAV